MKKYIRLIHNKSIFTGDIEILRRSKAATSAAYVTKRYKIKKNEPSSFRLAKIVGSKKATYRKNYIEWEYAGND